MKTTSNNNNNTEKTIDSYNADAMSAYMRSLMGDEMYERFKPTRNINDIVSGRANDN